MTADTESAERLKNADSTNRWKIGIASVAGAALVGITGGLAAPLVAAGLGAVMGGLGLGATVTAGYLGAVASSGAMMGALFGAYGGKMGGEVMERYAKEVSDFSFLPLQEGGEARLRVAVGVTGWVVDDAAEEVVAPWRVLGGGLEGYALRWEVEALTDLGKALQGILSSFAMGWVKTEIIKRTVFATLYSALWPIGLLKAAKVIDNPYFIAKARSEKAGLVLADAIIHKTQGERPITLVGFSLGARVVYTCLMSLAERGAFGLVENVVMMGSPVPASVETWRTIRTVVSGRVVNVYSGQDYILAFLYRTSSIQLGVAGLQKIDVEGVENVDLGEKGQGHLKYGLVAAGVLGELLTGDVVTVEAKKGEEFLGELVKETARKRQGVTEDQLEEKGKEDDEDVEKVVEKARRELDERRRLRQEKK